MTAPAFVSVASVLDYLELNTPGTTSQYSSATVGSNIRAASWTLEKATQRWFMDRPGVTWTGTSNGRAQVYIPGLRSASAVSIQTAPLVANASYWLLPDVQQTGVYTGLQLRAFTSAGRDPGRPWLANPNWFDMNLDSPWFPGNYGGGFNQSSLPNDLVVTGDWGYTAANLPEPLLHATKVLAAFYTLRPNSLLADVAITPAGGVVNYSALPNEVLQFIAEWKIGEAAVVI